MKMKLDERARKSKRIFTRPFFPRGGINNSRKLDRFYFPLDKSKLSLYSASDDSKRSVKAQNSACATALAPARLAAGEISSRLMRAMRA
jgi:hypothetical protein